MSLELKLVADLKTRLEEMRDRAKIDIADGICKDMKEYGYSLGYIRGMNDAVTVALEMEQDLIKGE